MVNAAAGSLGLSLFLVWGGAFAAEWSGFRGPNSSGVAPSAHPPTALSPTNRVLWSVEVPWAPSSPTVAGDRLFLTTFAAGKLETRAYSTRDGKLLWAQAAPVDKLEDYHGTEGSPSAGSPVTDGEVVVSYFGSFGLVVYDQEGHERWRQRMPVAQTGGNFGSGTSPLLVEGRVILNRDMLAGSSLMAFDAKSGKPLWETPRPESPTSYGTPIVWTHGATTELVVAGSLSLKGYDLATGKERWTVRGLPSFSCTTPVVGDGLLYYAGWSPGKADSPWPSWDSVVEREDKDGDGKITAAEYSSGPVWFKSQDLDGDGFLTRKDWETMGNMMRRGENVLLAVKPDGHGDITDTHVVWKFGKGLPYVPSPLYYDGRVYLVKDGGMMTSVDAKTGQAVYSQERLPAQGGYYASPVAAGGRIYLVSLQGKWTEIKAGGEKPEVVHTADFGERIAGTPALVGDRVYLRTQTKLYAFGDAPAR